MAKRIHDTWCIVAADGSRARFFTLESPDLPLLEGGPDLVEHGDLVNPDHQLKGTERFATQSGRQRPPGGGLPHTYDDHRTNHMAESETRFARRLADAVQIFAESRGAQHLILSADPRLLGMLRPELSRRLGNALDVRVLARDVSGLTRPQIHAQLSEAGLVPRREPPDVLLESRR